MAGCRRRRRGGGCSSGHAGAAVDRTQGSSARLGALEYGNPIFEPFKAARTGDFSSARFYSYRASFRSRTRQIVARFDDGAPALIERRVGNGRVLMWTSSLDLRVERPAAQVGLPAVRPSHGDDSRSVPGQARMAHGRRCARDRSRRRWSRGLPVPPQRRMVLTPSGQRVSLDGEGPDVARARRAGLLRGSRQGPNAPPVVTVASNVDLAESDLSPMDPQDVVAGVTGRAGGAAPRRDQRPDDRSGPGAEPAAVVVPAVRRAGSSRD